VWCPTIGIAWLKRPAVAQSISAETVVKAVSARLRAVDDEGRARQRHEGGLDVAIVLKSCAQASRPPASASVGQPRLFAAQTMVRVAVTSLPL